LIVDGFKEEDRGSREPGERRWGKTRSHFITFASRLRRFLRKASTALEYKPIMERERKEVIMVSRIQMLLGLLLAAALCIGTTAVTAQAQTSGSIAFETSADSSQMNTVWTGCVIFFQGKEQRCSVTGLQVPTMGAGVARVSGLVNNVKNIGDVAGTYQAVGVDPSLGAGHLQLKNSTGVTMTLWAIAQMTEMQVGSAGMKIELKEK
jgi:hypothetical protein